jgi:hypothetical protein
MVGHKTFEISARQLKRLSATAELAQFEMAEQLAHAMRSIYRFLRSGHAFGGEQCGEHAVAGCIAGGDTFPHRQVAATRRVQRNVRRHRQRDSLGDPVAIEPQNPGRADRAATAV